MTALAGFASFAIVDAADVESIASFVLRQAQQDGNDRPDMEEVAFWLGAQVRNDKDPDAVAWFNEDECAIYCRPFGKDRRYRNVALAHELGHLGWAMVGVDVEHQDEEIVDQIARAILIPNVTELRALVRRYGSIHAEQVGAAYPHLPPHIVALRAIDLGMLW